MMHSVLAICVGASAGALLRWSLGNALNALFPHLPPGTLLANLSGSFLIGLIISWLAQNPQVSVEWRLLLITGFLGSLTTFSTFSAEVIGLFHQQKFLWGFATVSVHVLGCLLMTAAGFALWQLLQR